MSDIHNPRAFVFRILTAVQGSRLSTGHETTAQSRLKTQINRYFLLRPFGRFAVGPYWSQMSAAQKVRYLDLLRSWILDATANAMASRGLVAFNILSVRKIGPKDWLVESSLSDRQQRQRIVYWRVRRLHNEFRIVDVLPDGISLARVRRSEFTSILKRNNGDIVAFLNILAARVKRKR